jgi:hypothetical protein
MSQSMFAVRATAVCIALSALASPPARAAGRECNKADLPSVTGAQRFEGATLIFIAGEAQAQGEANFGVQYASRPRPARSSASRSVMQSWSPSTAPGRRATAPCFTSFPSLAPGEAAQRSLLCTTGLLH